MIIIKGREVKIKKPKRRKLGRPEVVGTESDEE